jgi:hypothetical protein
MTMQPVFTYAPPPAVFQQTQTLVSGTAVPASPSVVYEFANGESHPLTVYTAGLPLLANGSPARYAGLWVKILWTRNGATFSQIHPANKRVTIVASRVEVTPFIRPLLTSLGALPAGVSATVNCTVTNGNDGESLIPSLWIPSADPLGNPIGFRGQIAPYPSLTFRLNGLGPLLLLRAQGYNAGATGRYIMFFDIESDPSAVPAGTLLPLCAAFVQPNGGTFSFDQSNSGYAVHQGLWWCVSSTADFLTADAAATFRVDAEIEAYEVQRAALQAGG